MATGILRQETGRDELGAGVAAGAAGVGVALGTPDEGADGAPAGVLEPQAAMKTTPNGAKNLGLLGTLKGTSVGKKGQAKIIAAAGLQDQEVRFGEPQRARASGSIPCSRLNEAPTAPTTAVRRDRLARSRIRNTASMPVQ